MHSFLQFLRDDNPGSSEDNLNFVISDDCKYELGMLLSSRPLYHEREMTCLLLIALSLNYGIKASVYGVSASEHSDTVNSEISSRILITLQRYESRLGNPVVEHLFSDDNYSFFHHSVFMDSVKFCIKWDKHSGEFSLDE